MLVQKFPKASPEKHLLRGFSYWWSDGRLARPGSRAGTPGAPNYRKQN